MTITRGPEMGNVTEVEADLIGRCAAEFDVPLSAPVRSGLAIYGRLLLAWGGRINLTAAKSFESLVADHLPDAFAIARRLSGAGGAGEGVVRVVDVGSGGGLPALPLALLRPANSFTLFEATGKKVAFLRTAIRSLGLGDRVQVRHARIDLPSPFEASFDIAVSRAALQPAAWLALGARLVRTGGTVFCLSSRRLDSWPPELSLADQSSYRRDRWVAELRRST